MAYQKFSKTSQLTFSSHLQCLATWTWPKSTCCGCKIFWCFKWTFRDQFGTFKFKVHQRNENIGGFMWRSFFSLTVDCCSGLVRGISPKCSKFKIYRNLGVSVNAILYHQMISPTPQKRSRLLRAWIFHTFLLRPAILDLFKVDFYFLPW